MQKLALSYGLIFLTPLLQPANPFLYDLSPSSTTFVLKSLYTYLTPPSPLCR